MGYVLTTEQALEAIAQGAHVVHLSERERELARLRPEQVLVAEDEAEGARLKRLYAIRMEHEQDRGIVL